MTTTFSTDALIGVVESLLSPPQWALDRYFRTINQSDSETINFDLILGRRRVAPFCSPLVAGKVVQAQGRQVNTFQPAYIKDKRRINPGEGLKRAVGERIGGALSAQERLDAYIASQLSDQIDMVNRRLEIMAVEALRTGKVTVVGDDYPSVVVDFQRDAALTLADLAGAAKWDQATAKPLKNLNAWAKQGLQKSGAFLSDVIMGLDAWDNFSDNADVKAQLDNRNVTNARWRWARSRRKAAFTGERSVASTSSPTAAGMSIRPTTPRRKSSRPAKSFSPAPQSRVFARSARSSRARHLKAFPYYPKTWEENDPSVEWLMMQSSPLMVPARANATLKVKVV
jgi:hypothetical protein